MFNGHGQQSLGKKWELDYEFTFHFVQFTFVVVIAVQYNTNVSSTRLKILLNYRNLCTCPEESCNFVEFVHSSVA